MIPREAAPSESIPFRIRLGVTGHREVEPDRKLPEVLARIRGLVPERERTPVRLGVISALAEGADRLVVDAVFDDAAMRGEEARLEVVLPFEKRRYIELQEFSATSEAEFEAWLERAITVIELGGSWGPKQREISYKLAGQQIVNRCDVLVALWDGKPSRGCGGTAETLLFAAGLGKPCIWVPTDDEVTCVDNLAKGRNEPFLEAVRQRALVTQEGSNRRQPTATGVLSLKDTFRELDMFNRSALPPKPDLRRRLAQELGAVDENSEWVAGPFTRATVLADRYRLRFTWAAWLMSTLATGAAVCLGASVIHWTPSPVLAWAELGFLCALVLVFALSRWRGLHRRWLSYRLLAERFRSAYFMAPTGIDFRGSAGLEAIFVEGPSGDWPIRGFEEVWGSRPNAVGRPRLPSEEEVEGLTVRLAEQWIGGQVEYHERERQRHVRWSHLLTSLVGLFFIGAVVFAGLHALDLVERLSIFLSVTLPTAAAAVGVILTVHQHRALAERYGRMRSRLVSVQESLRNSDAQTIRKATSDAARVIAEENGDWFGAMWFLDVELPP